MKLYTHFLRRSLSLGLTIILTTFSLSGCQNPSMGSDSESPSANQAEEINISFEEFTDQLFLEEITANTINLHYCVENPTALGITDYEISLGDFSKEARESASTYLNETLSEVLSYDYEILSVENQLTYDLLVD